MSCIKLRLREKTAAVRLWQSFLPWICNNKAAEGKKSHRHIILDGSAWMSAAALTQVRREQLEKPGCHQCLTLKAFHEGSFASWCAIGRWHRGGGCDTLRCSRNKKVFLSAKRWGKLNDSSQRLSMCSCSKRWVGTWGSSVKRSGRKNVCRISLLHLVHCSHVRKEARL